MRLIHVGEKGFKKDVGMTTAQKSKETGRIAEQYNNWISNTCACVL